MDARAVGISAQKKRGNILKDVIGGYDTLNTDAMIKPSSEGNPTGNNRGAKR
jgi:hypothetical protein